MCMLPVLSIGQTTTENYIKNTTYQVETETDNVSEEQKIENITYFDGLGRTKQSIAVKAGGDKQNIVSHTEYDALGRSPKQYLPYATAVEIPNPLAITSSQSLKANISNFYNSPKYEDTQNPYSQMIYEASSLNRVFEQAAPGNSWALSEGHTIKMSYQINLDSEVRYYDVSFSEGNTSLPGLILNGFYGQGELHKNVTKDENWTSTSGNNHTTEEFTNKLGQVVLKRAYNDNVAHDTYYIYDNFGNLSFVLSPEASNQIVSGNTLASNYQEILDKLGYQYKYDYRNRLIEKKIPAKGWEHIVYNKLDQPVLTQDANQRAKTPQREWLFTKYDAFGRVIYTGIKKANISRASFQSIVDNTTGQAQYEQRSADPITAGGTTIYYTQNAVPTGVDEILTVNYYDSYVDIGVDIPDTVYGQNITEDLQGLSTVSKVKVLTDGDHWITTITGYDDKARPIYSTSLNTYLNTQDTSESLLDFTAKVIESRTIHQKGNHQEVVTKDFFSYDHQNRLITQMQQIGDEPLQLIASNTYDELGQLEVKYVGGALFESGYTDITDNYITILEDEVITKTDGGSSLYNAGLSTVGKIEGDGGLSFINVVSNKRYIVGFNDNSSSSSSSAEIDYGFLFAWNNPGRYKVRIRENNVTSYITEYINTQAGDHFAIEREGNVLSFIHNGAIVATHTMTQNFPSLVGDVSIRDEGTQIGNLNLYAINIDKSLQKINYKYNVRGWLTDINDVNVLNRTSALFNFHINYDDTVEGDAGIAGRATPLYNGNISQTTWRTANVDGKKRTYGYKYDALNRIKAGYSRKGTNLTEYDHFNVSNIDYDKNGNIENLTRQGDYNGNALAMDDLTYTYNGNQLLNVSDNGHANLKKEGFFDGNTSGDDYLYDLNGNMISDKNKGITDAITYNHLNLPETVKINTVDPQGDTQQGTINYIYDATGIKLAKIVNDEFQNSTITTSYAGGYIYENNNGYEQLMMFPHPEGYVEPVYGTTKSIQKFSKSTQTISFSGYQYVFNYKDHLGNVRLTYSDSDGDGAIKPSVEIISEKNYYPFGLQQQGYNDVVTSNVNSVANRFSFGGKELGDELGLNWYDISARNYDPAIGRWMNLDPLAEQMRRHSPYNFAFDNPIYFTDPDGMMPQGPGPIRGTSTAPGLGFIFKRFQRIAENYNQGQSLGTAIWNGVKGEVAATADFTPGVGDAKGLVEVFTGEDSVTGEELGASRYLGLLMLSELRYLDDAADAVTDIAKTADGVADEGGNFVYRSLADGEDASKGLTARAPDATDVSELSHVAGKRDSPWISTTKDSNTAINKYNNGSTDGVVRIDLNKLPSNVKVSDISNGIPNGGRFSNYAVKDLEVLLQGYIPPSAINTNF